MGLKPLIFAAALALSGAAHGTVTLDWQGRFSTGSNLGGVFGPATDLQDVPFKVVFVFDETTPGAGSSGPTYNQLFGYGPQQTPPDTTSPGHATVTVNGVDFGIAGDLSSELLLDDGTPDRIDAYAFDDAVANIPDPAWMKTIAYAFAHFDVIPTGPMSRDWHSQMTFNPGTLSGNGYLLIYNYGPPGQVTVNQQTYNSWVEGFVDMSSLSLLVNGGAPVPEASTWLMMVAGFGLTGAAIRGARRSAELEMAISPSSPSAPEMLDPND